MYGWPSAFATSPAKVEFIATSASFSDAEAAKEFVSGLCGLDEVDQLVTGPSADPESLRVIAETGVEVRVA